MAHTPSRATVAALSVVLAALVTACSSPASPTGASSEPTLTGAAAGQVIYERSCSSCHGVGGVGSKFSMDNNTIEVPAITFADLSDMYGDQFDSMAKTAITEGLDEEGQPLNKMMPRWTIFSDQELTDLTAYLKTLQ
jgi:mono/diheme cytochrome c family protein